MQLNDLYHWAPRRLRAKILQEGLRTMVPKMVEGTNGEPTEVQFPWLCFATTPRRAWSLLPDLWAEDIDDGGVGWDLWQVEPSHDDYIAIRNDQGAEIIEVRIHNSIPPHRVWWVAERSIFQHDNLPKLDVVSAQT